MSTAVSLREIERDAPKHLKTLLLQAATEIEQHESNARECVTVLDTAIKQRAGAMDSESRAMQISDSIRVAMRIVMDKLKT